MNGVPLSNAGFGAGKTLKRINGCEQLKDLEKNLRTIRHASNLKAA